MVLLLSISLLMWKGAKRGLIISLWVCTLAAMLALYRYHLTAALDVSL